jgi:hypothetical protein
MPTCRANRLSPETPVRMNKVARTQPASTWARPRGSGYQAIVSLVPSFTQGHAAHPYGRASSTPTTDLLVLPNRDDPYDDLVSIPGRTVSRPRQRLLPACVAAVIFGIVGMHALIQHCPTPPHTMPMATSAVHTAHQTGEHLTAAVASAPIGIMGLQVTDHPTGGLDEMLILCAAMLLGAGAILMLLLRRRGDRPIALLPMSMSRWRPSLIMADNGPPRTLAFTVIRC